MNTVSTPPHDSINPLRSEIIECLCQSILAPKTTEVARIMATQLIADLAHLNQSMKEMILHLLSTNATELIGTIGEQLQVCVIEVFFVVEISQTCF